MAFIARLLVDPGARRLGTGARLLDRARREAAARERVPMLDVVDLQASAAAVSLYRREGWMELGRASITIDGRQIDELVFRGPGS